MTTLVSLLEARGVIKQFARGTSVTKVLQGVSATFAQGTTYAITGFSGSGKSTLLHLLAGLDRPDEGSVLFNGRDIALFRRKEKEQFLNQTIGLVFQSPYLIAELSVIENVMLKGIIAGANKKKCRVRAQELLRRVGLEEKENAHPASLSGGQQQRVALIRALFNKPVFLIADEPTVSLDRQTARSIVQLLLEYQREFSMGLIMSSHDPYVIEQMNEVYDMTDGILKKVKV